MSRLCRALKRGQLHHGSDGITSGVLLHRGVTHGRWGCGKMQRMSQCSVGEAGTRSIHATHTFVWHVSKSFFCPRDRKLQAPRPRSRPPSRGARMCVDWHGLAGRVASRRDPPVDSIFLFCKRTSPHLCTVHSFLQAQYSAFSMTPQPLRPYLPNSSTWQHTVGVSLVGLPQHAHTIHRR